MIAFFTHHYTDKLIKSNYVKLPSEVLHELVTKALMFKDIPLKGTQQFETHKILILVKRTNPET
jgi:hypothetical protein